MHFVKKKQTMASYQKVAPTFNSLHILWKGMP